MFQVVQVLHEIHIVSSEEKVVVDLDRKSVVAFSVPLSTIGDKVHTRVTLKVARFTSACAQKYGGKISVGALLTSKFCMYWGFLLSHSKQRRGRRKWGDNKNCLALRCAARLQQETTLGELGKRRRRTSCHRFACFRWTSCSGWDSKAQQRHLVIVWPWRSFVLPSESRKGIPFSLLRWKNVCRKLHQAW